MRTLYTLDSKGKIRVFECEIGLTGPATPTTAYTYTRTGLLGGKLIEKKELVTKGKQGRTINQQAEFQAQSLWNEKLDEGYKSEEDLVKALTKLGVDTSVGINLLINQANHHIPNWYMTNSNFDELPMLAMKFKDVKVPSYPYYCQPKLDGVRMMTKFEPNPPEYKGLDKVKLISRGGQYYQIPHLEGQLIQLYTFLLKAYGHSNFILDGEIYKHGTPLQEISGAARKEVGDVLFASNSWLEYWIYDIIDLNNIDATQEERNEVLFNINKIILDNIKFVQTCGVDNQADVDLYHDLFVSEGYEGLILRNQTALYEFNQRSKGLLKVKQYQDEEFEIIGFEVDTNKSIEESFVFILKNNINNLTFKSRPTGSGEQKKEWYRILNQTEGATQPVFSIIGKKATVRFFARSNDGLPTQGVVRDKDTEVLHIRPKGE